MLPTLVLRRAVAAAVASSSLLGFCCWFSQFDCSPVLFVQDAWMQRHRRLKRHRQHPPGIFHGQSIWIIGASSGIGAELVRRLAHNYYGVDHLIVSSRSTEKLYELVKECQQQQQQQQQEHDGDDEQQQRSSAKKKHKQQGPPQIHVVPLDVTNETNDWNEIVDSLSLLISNKSSSISSSSSHKRLLLPQPLPPLPQNRRRPDIVIFNTGRGDISPVIDTNPQIARTMLSTNVAWFFSLVPILLVRQQPKPSPASTATTTSSSSRPTNIAEAGADGTNTDTQPQTVRPSPLQSLQSQLHHLPPQFFVTSSIAGIVPVPLSAAYAASKHAVMGYFRSVAAEHPNLIVDLVCPGPIDNTNFFFDSGSSSSSSSAENINNKKDDEKTVMTGGTADTDTSNSRPNNRRKRKNLKMPLNRCVDLMLTTLEQSNRLRKRQQLQIQQQQQQQQSTNTGTTPTTATTTKTSGGGRLREVWTVEQPTLTALYLQRFMSQRVIQWCITKIGQRRMDMYKQGYDLYDPTSWTKSKKSKAQQATVARDYTDNTTSNRDQEHQ